VLQRPSQPRQLFWEYDHSPRPPAASIMLAIPRHHSPGEYSSMRFLLLTLIMASWSVWLPRAPMADAKASTSLGGTIRPFQFSVTKSAPQPAASLRITGKPQAIASFTTKPQVSV